MGIILKIVSPEKIEFDGEVERVNVPGSEGNFEILQNHAPIISSLQQGTVEYINKTGLKTVDIIGGFVEVLNNEVSLCVEKLQ